MKKTNKKILKNVLIILSIIIIFLIINLGLYTYDNYFGKKKVIEDLPNVISDEYKSLSFEALDNEQSVFKEIVYEGKTEEEVINQINKSLSSTIANTADIYVKKSLENGVDPYVAVAISLYETGCKWGCSTLVKDCYNLGGIKGSPSCNGSSFKRFNTLEEGIESFVNVIASYYNNGMDTPEKMEYRYSGGSKTWASKVNNYIREIKSK